MYKYLASLRVWENPRLCSSNVKFKKGDRVILKEETDNDLGIIETDSIETKEAFPQKIIRKASPKDIQTAEENEKQKKEILEICHKEIRKLKIEMKLVDAWITLGRGSVVIAFTAGGRIDFRDLVKNLSRKFHRSVRMRQIGSRDETRKLGGCGICGRELCCVKFPGNLPSISSDMARVQQIAHRGSERISGVCGRLMCCLAYEAQQYRELLSEMPEIHSVVKTAEGEGEVMEVNALKQEIRIKLKNKQIITVKKEDLK